MLHAAQIGAGRALLGWRQEQLAKASGIGTATIRQIQRSAGPVGGYVSTLMRVQSAFEKAGILFLDDDAGGGIGVRLQKKRVLRNEAKSGWHGTGMASPNVR